MILIHKKLDELVSDAITCKYNLLNNNSHKCYKIAIIPTNNLCKNKIRLIKSFLKIRIKNYFKCNHNKCSNNNCFKILELIKIFLLYIF